MTERNMKITNEGVLPDTQTNPETFAKMTAFRKDPIEAFKSHVYNCGVNMCDVFNVDNDLKLSVVDFKDLIKVRFNNRKVLGRNILSNEKL